jgi:archaellum component FlaF (FlaF/FlaG flagellin family)
VGGIATVVAAAIISLVFIQLFTTYYGASINNSNTLLGSIQQQAAIEAVQASEHISITNIQKNSGTSLTVQVTNTGQTSIAAVNFTRMDVIIMYTAQFTRQVTTLWLTYTTSQTATNAWRVTNVYVGNNLAPVQDPINLPAATSGRWDPGETLVISIRLSNSASMITYDAVMVQMTTPNGVSTSSSD